MSKRKKKRITTRNKIIIGAVAAAMFITTITVFIFMFGNYDGLGLKKNISENSYDMSKLYKKNGLKHYDDGTYKSVVGIDVSTYQNKVNWEKVKGAGVDFAMIRVGYRGSENGSLALDDRYKENVKGARDAGLDVGVYFFSQAKSTKEAISEAQFVIRHIRGKGIEFPVVFDMEPIAGADRITDLTVKEKTKIADAFCQTIERKGYKPMIYGNPGWLTTKVDLGYLTNYEVWLAHYTDATDYPYEYQIWQYTHRGKIAGVKGHVDLNIYFKEE